MRKLRTGRQYEAPVLFCHPGRHRSRPPRDRVRDPGQILLIWHPDTLRSFILS